MIYVWIVFVVITFVLISLLSKKDKNDGNLPGPPAVPFFGNIFQLINAFKTYTFPFTYLAKTYGEIYRLKVPMDEIVVLASYETITTVLSKDEASGRDGFGIMIDRGFGKNLGFAMSNGIHQDITKKWTVKNLRNFGFGSVHKLEEFINGEINAFVNDLEKTADNDGKIIFRVDHTFLLSISHIMYKMLAGANCIIDKKTLMSLNEHTTLMEKASGLTGTVGGALAVYIPQIRYIFPEWTGRNIHLKCRSVFQKESRRLLALAREKMSCPEAEAESLTEKFVAAQMNPENQNQNELFQDLNYDLIFTDLFQASSNTTSSYLESLFLYMILYPEVQEKIYQEIQTTIVPGQDVTYEHKSRMIYTHATMLEVHRIANIAPYLVPRRTIADMQYKNFRIKKNCMIVSDVNSFYSCSETFPEPTRFKPDRFINSDGTVSNQKIVMFAFGCPGERFADVTDFLFAVNLIRKYKLSIAPGHEKPKTEMKIGITSCPQPFSMLMTKRE